jgi:hypothetical protein
MSKALAVDAAWLFVAFLIIALLAAGGIAVRRILLDRGGGTVDCGMRRRGGPWRLGVAAYRPHELRWYQVFGVRLTPDEVLDRSALSVVSRRLADPDETVRLGEGAVVVECRGGDGRETIELAMGEAALTGFLAWLEAAPPGSYQGRVSLPPRGLASLPRPGRPRRFSARRLAATIRRRLARLPAGRE